MRSTTDQYPTGVKAEDAMMAALHLTADEFHGEWNHAIAPSESELTSKQARRLRAKL